MRKYHGYLSLDDVEGHIGTAFSQVLLELNDSPVIPFPWKSARTVAYEWDCGCEYRGSGGHGVWSACKTHRNVAAELPTREIPTAYNVGGCWVTRSFAAADDGGAKVFLTFARDGDMKIAWRRLS